MRKEDLPWTAPQRVREKGEISSCKLLGKEDAEEGESGGATKN